MTMLDYVQSKHNYKSLLIRLYVLGRQKRWQGATKEHRSPGDKVFFFWGGGVFVACYVVLEIIIFKCVCTLYAHTHTYIHIKIYRATTTPLYPIKQKVIIHWLSVTCCRSPHFIGPPLHSLKVNGINWTWILLLNWVNS